MCSKPDWPAVLGNFMSFRPVAAMACGGFTRGLRGARPVGRRAGAPS
jgi:hypothetical protein